MLQPELLKSVIDALKLTNIDYMVTGSIASSIYGPPRLTYDIDIIIAIVPDDVDSLLSAFPTPRYYYDRGQGLSCPLVIKVGNCRPIPTAQRSGANSP